MFSFSTIVWNNVLSRSFWKSVQCQSWLFHWWPSFHNCWKSLLSSSSLLAPIIHINLSLRYLYWNIFVFHLMSFSVLIFIVFFGTLLFHDVFHSLIKNFGIQCQLIHLVAYDDVIQHLSKSVANLWMPVLPEDSIAQKYCKFQLPDMVLHICTRNTVISRYVLYFSLIYTVRLDH